MEAAHSCDRGGAFKKTESRRNEERLTASLAATPQFNALLLVTLFGPGTAGYPLVDLLFYPSHRSWT